MMSQLVFKMAFDGQSSSAQKTYGAVPIAECWTHQQINAELLRSGVGIDYRVMCGCVSALVRAGLVAEVSKGQFRRMPVRAAITKPEKETDTVKEIAMTPATTTATETPMDKLGALSVRVTSMAKALQALAEDIGNVAIEVQSEVEANDSDMKKLKQLQSLLKSLG